jgi:hypothetical protein
MSAFAKTFKRMVNPQGLYMGLYTLIKDASRIPDPEERRMALESAYDRVNSLYAESKPTNVQKKATLLAYIDLLLGNRNNRIRLLSSINTSHEIGRRIRRDIENMINGGTRKNRKANRKGSRKANRKGSRKANRKGSRKANRK